ncbi:unnamed protein product [Polarella glacialis]|uniref:Coenzyme Q-binding protein COQ10 START domain-containing protein n=1 Tax=Polarella glacialis TaxID=89957 RepID=A0A813GBU7_POLGL|nr:unnamed protein product [Polarella glacialis]
MAVSSHRSKSANSGTLRWRLSAPVAVLLLMALTYAVSESGLQMPVLLRCHPESPLLVPVSSAFSYWRDHREEEERKKFQFQLDVSDFTPAEAVRRHAGSSGGPPVVQSLRTGSPGGLFAVKGTLRIPVAAPEVFKWLTDPEMSAHIFARHVASCNYRKALDIGKRTIRYFEVSKTGRWRLLGIHFKFESTVIVREDWQQMQATYRQARPGAMRHFSGFWQVVPTGKSESLVMFYTEAIPGFPLPAILRRFARRALEYMARSTLQDLQATAIQRQSATPHG